VVVNSFHRPEKLTETVERIRAVGGDAVAVRGDVGEEETWKTLVATALEHYGKINVLVQNAAGFGRGSTLEATREQFDQYLSVTLIGSWMGAKYCVPEMAKVGGGSIVFISSVNGTITNPRFGLYSASKGGLNALARSIAVDYGRQGIRCNAIAPGQIVGEREKPWLAKNPIEDAACHDCYPIGRYGYPQEIANVALFLASDEASFVTGIVLTADGGLTLQSPEALVRPSFRKHWRNDILVPQPIPEGWKEPWEE
jgi:NAD(P)-dependent dehydrogenase (short-subunit alcohol dehydrogenase family)